MLRRQKHALSESTTPFACTLQVRLVPVSGPKDLSFRCAYGEDLITFSDLILLLFFQGIAKIRSDVGCSFQDLRDGFWRDFDLLSGPVLRDTARLSQRYPPIARYGDFGVSTWPIGCDTPSPFSERFPHEEHAKWRCDTPPEKGYLSDTGAIPYENKANGCDTPLCDTISKGYCAIWGGISHWATKLIFEPPAFFLRILLPKLSPHFRETQRGSAGGGRTL